MINSLITLFNSKRSIEVLESTFHSLCTCMSWIKKTKTNQSRKYGDFNFPAKNKTNFAAEDLEAISDIISLIQPYGVII